MNDQITITTGSANIIGSGVAIPIDKSNSIIMMVKGVKFEFVFMEDSALNPDRSRQKNYLVELETIKNEHNKDSGVKIKLTNFDNAFGMCNTDRLTLWEFPDRNKISLNFVVYSIGPNHKQIHYCWYFGVN